MAHAPRPTNRWGDFWIFLHVIGYVWPIILLLGGYTLSVMHTRVFVSPPADIRGDLYFWLFWEAIATFAWLIIDFFVITSQKSSSTHLVVNIALSKTMSDILVFLAGGMVFMGILEWWMVVPVVGAMADDYITSNRAVINALQKPFGLPGAEGH